MAKKTHQFQQSDARGRLILGAAGAALALRRPRRRRPGGGLRRLPRSQRA